MEDHKRSRELDLALFNLHAELCKKLGDGYKDMCYFFDKMGTEEILETITTNIRRAYPGYVLGELVQTNDILESSLEESRNEIYSLEDEKNTYKEKMESLEKENKELLHMMSELQKRLDKRVKNSRDDINIEEVKYLYKNGMSVIEIAKMFQTNRQTIYNKLHKPSTNDGLYD